MFFSASRARIQRSFYETLAVVHEKLFSLTHCLLVALFVQTGLFGTLWMSFKTAGTYVAPMSKYC